MIHSLPLNNMGFGALDFHPVENLCITYSWPLVSEVPPSLQFLCICASVFMDSTNLGSCSTVVFTTEKNPHVTSAVQTHVVQGSTVYELMYLFYGGSVL